MSYPPYPQQAVAVRPQCSTAHIVIAWVLAVLTALYLLPWAIAATRSKSNVGVIAVINIFLGWSLIGWIAALVMACVNDSPSVVVINNGYPAMPPALHPGHQPNHHQSGPAPYGYGPPALPPGARQSPPPVVGPPALGGVGQPQYPFGQPQHPFGQHPFGQPQHAFGLSSMDASDTYPEITQELPVDPYVHRHDPALETFDPYAEDDRRQ